MKKKRKNKIKIILALVLFLLIAGSIAIFCCKNNGDHFEVDNILLKFSIKENSELIKKINIKNLNTQEPFQINIENIDFISVDKNNFYIEKGETEEISLLINSNSIEPEVYIGRIKIISEEEKTIPIIIEVESRNNVFDNRLNMFYTDVSPEETLNYEVKIFDLYGGGKKEIKLITYIRDFSGKNFFSSEDDFVVDNQISLSKNIKIPKELKYGDYVLINEVKYEESLVSSTNLFSVVKKDLESTNSLFFIIGIFGLFFIISVILFIYSINSRDKLIVDLQKQYKFESKKQRELIKEEEKKNFKKLNNNEKKEYKKEVHKIMNKRLNELKNIHKKRLEKARKIKKSGKKDELKKQLENWKKQGYNTNVLEKKYKMPDVKEIKRKIKNWKKQGYNTDILNSR